MSSNVKKVFDKLFENKRITCMNPILRSTKRELARLEYYSSYALFDIMTKNGYCKRIRAWKPNAKCERAMCPFVAIEIFVGYKK